MKKRRKETNTHECTYNLFKKKKIQNLRFFTIMEQSTSISSENLLIKKLFYSNVFSNKYSLKKKRVYLFPTHS